MGASTAPAFLPGMMKDNALRTFQMELEDNGNVRVRMAACSNGVAQMIIRRPMHWNH